MSEDLKSLCRKLTIDILRGKFVSNTYLHKENKRIDYNYVKKPKKLFTFIMALKNRPERARLTMESIVNEINYQYADFIIVEDVSDNLLNIEGYEKYIEHHLVDTGYRWIKSSLLNYGIKRAKTPLCVVWDADFIFPEQFMLRLLKMLMYMNIETQYFAIPSFETHDSVITDREYKEKESYGNLWVYPTSALVSVKGLNESIYNHGMEERELEKRLNTFIKPVYTFNINRSLFVFHYSHEDDLRGERNYLVDLKLIEDNETWGEIKEL